MQWAVRKIECQISRLSEKWGVRLVGCQKNGVADQNWGLLKQWAVEQRAVRIEWLEQYCENGGLLKQWAVSAVGCQNVGLLEDSGLLQRWAAGKIGGWNWSFRTVGCRNHGLSEHGFVETFGCQNNDSRDSALLKYLAARTAALSLL